MEFKFFVNPVLLQVNDSLELDSGQTLASLEYDNKLITLDVRGDVRVRFNGQIYKTPSGFPEELMDIIHRNAWNNNKCEIFDNNWFEVFVYEKNPEWKEDSNIAKWIWTGCSDTVESYFDKAQDVFAFLLDFGTYYQNEYKAIQEYPKNIGHDI